MSADAWDKVVGWVGVVVAVVYFLILIGGDSYGFLK
jgi:hypothetical protein